MQGVNFQMPSGGQFWVAVDSRVVLRSDGEGEFGEGGREPMLWILIHAASGCSASGVAELSSPGMWLCGDRGQAAAGTPTTSFQAVNRVSISWR